MTRSPLALAPAPRPRPRTRPVHLELALAMFVALVVMGCGAPPKTPPPGQEPPLASLYVEALRREAIEPLDAKSYLAVVEHALTRPQDPHAFAALAAALDALVWREVSGLEGVEHAVAHRSLEALQETTGRLRNAWASELGTPFMRGLIATALHDLALRVGAAKDAHTWRRRSGCVQRAALAGPLAWPGVTALDAPSPIGPTTPMPAELPGVAPFANRAVVETVLADACALPIDETSPLVGLRVLVVDVNIPRAQNVYVALTSANAAVLDVGGRRVINREFAAGGSQTTRLGLVHAEAGRLRVVLRLAYRHDGNRVALQLWDEQGQPLETMAPRRGELATARATRAGSVDVSPAPGPHELAVAVGGWLALGESRRAVAALEGHPNDAPPFELDLLRVRALQAAEHLPRNQLRMQVAAAAARAAEGCPRCWEARLYDAIAEEDRKGFGTGVYAAFAKLSVTEGTSRWTTTLSPLELAYVALQANATDLTDVARVAYDALSGRVANAPMVADLDARLFARHGPALLDAACRGGTSRASLRCLEAHIARSDLNGTLAELERLRDLRGSKAILRPLEVNELLAHGKQAEALQIYDAMPPAQRTLSLLGLFVGSDEAPAGARRFTADMLGAADAPYAYEPLARLLGVFTDPAATLEQAGAALVAQDRKDAFLPGAGTAVLRRLEHYELQGSGLLHYWLYDLRRVSGTLDVASGTWMGAPRIEGRQESRSLRRRIYKKDGRVLDPDPGAQGAQGDTDLSQLQAGDYVEALVMGWALPDDNGQLTVDTPDLLPPRTSIREGQITFRRAESVKLSLWSHGLLGEGSTVVSGTSSTTTWRLNNRPPRRIETGVPPLEARAALSFGTDSYPRIAAALAALHRTLDDRDPFMKSWVGAAVGDEQDTAKRVGRVVAAAGKALKQSDPGALSDWAASMGGGAQRETARTMLERGVGSRTWVVHRALRELGVVSEIVVAESRPWSAAPGFPPHTGRFTHPLVRAEWEGTVAWIDADVEGPPLPPGRVSPELRGRKALRNDGTMLTVEVPVSADVDRIAIDLELDAQGDASGTCSLVLYGRAAQQLVERFEVVVGSDRDAMLRSVVLAWVPWADVQEVKLESDETSWEVRVQAKILLVGFARPEQRDKPIYALPGITPVHGLSGATTTLGARYAQQADRKTALAIDTPLLYQVKRTIKLPPQAAVVKSPAPVKVVRDYLTAERTVTHDGGVIVDRFALNLPVGTIAPEAFAEFSKALEEVDDGFMHTLRVEIPASSP